MIKARIKITNIVYKNSIAIVSHHTFNIGGHYWWNQSYLRGMRPLLEKVQ